jgi:hypothetical protein
MAIGDCNTGAEVEGLQFRVWGCQTFSAIGDSNTGAITGPTTGSFLTRLTSEGIKFPGTGFEGLGSTTGSFLTRLTSEGIKFPGCRVHIVRNSRFAVSQLNNRLEV